MKKEVFFKILSEELEIEDSNLTENSLLHLTSLKTLALISLLDENFEIRLRAVDIKDINNIDSLMTLIGKEKFE